MPSIKTIVDSDSVVSFTTHTDTQLREWFMALVDVNQNVSLAELQKYLMADLPGTWSALRAESLTDPSCEWLMEVFSSNTKFDDLDVHHPAVVTIIDSIVANTNVASFTAVDKTAILALGTTQKPRYAAEGLSRLPAPDEIATARGI